MKLPSIQLLTTSLLQVIKRFPFVLLASLTGTLCALTLVHSHYDDKPIILTKLLMVSSLGLPLFFALHIFCERTMARPMFKFVAFITALFVLMQFYFSMKGWNTNDAPVFYRFFFWSAGLHLLVAFSAFFTEGELNGFWQFNKQLFLRFLTAALYSGVLYLGLAGAILAITELFGVEFHNKIYADLWIVIAGLFNTIFFLGGITEPVQELQVETAYPKGLKIFTQYVLLPLVTIYLVILYAYTAKILILMSLPKGWVANLILGFSITGILSLLLVWPLRDDEDNKWIKTFSRFYYFSLLPLVALLLIAIGTRISAYGVTIERYIVAMLGIWLALITLYFVVSKTKNIILIPVTLSLFLFGSCFGPWGMFKVSERSQVKRLHNLLEKNGALVNGKLAILAEPDVEKIKVRDINEMNSILDYLAKNHNLESIRPWMDAECQKQVFSDSLNEYPYQKEAALQQCIGIFGNTGYRDDEHQNEMNLNFYCNQFNDVNGLDISGYDHIYNFNAYDYGEGRYIDSSADSYTKLDKNRMSFYIQGRQQFQLPLDSIATKLRNLPHHKFNSYTTSAGDMTYEIAIPSGNKVKLMFSGFNSLVTDTALKVNSISGYLLIGGGK